MRDALRRLRENKTAGGSSEKEEKMIPTNRKAFLDMIAWSEIGPELLAASDNGYNVIVGSTPGHPVLFNSYADHPRQLVHFENGTPDSTAAGRYQIKVRIFDFYTKQLKLDGTFSPANQDAIALQLIKECHALPLIEAGNIVAAIPLCSSRWASLPGNTYGQRMNKLSALTGAYKNAGGQVV